MRGPHLGDGRETGVEQVRQAAGGLDAAEVRRDRYDRRPVQSAPAQVAGEERQCAHVVDRDREETLDLAGVQIDRQHPVGPGGFEHSRDQAGAYRLARRRLLVLSRVGEERQHGGDPVRRGESGRVDQQQQLEQVVVDRRRAGLDEEHVGAADRLAVAAVDLAVRERLELHRAQPDSRRRAMPSASSGFERPENSINAPEGQAQQAAQPQAQLRLSNTGA